MPKAVTRGTDLRVERLEDKCLLTIAFDADSPLDPHSNDTLETAQPLPSHTTRVEGVLSGLDVDTFRLVASPGTEVALRHSSNPSLFGEPLSVVAVSDALSGRLLGLVHAGPVNLPIIPPVVFEAGSGGLILQVVNASQLGHAEYSISISRPQSEPDIIASSLSWDDTGAGVELEYTVEDAALPRAAVGGLYWSETDSYHPSRAALAYELSIGTREGSFSRTVSRAELSEPPEGTRSLIFVVDPQNDIGESRESNNALAISLPDIAVHDVTTTDFREFTIEYEIKHSDAPAFLLKAYLSSDRILDPGIEGGSDLLIPGQEGVSDRAARSVGDHTATLRLPSRAPVDPEHRFVLIVADPEDTVHETDEENNLSFAIPLVPLWQRINRYGLIQNTDTEGASSGPFHGRIPQEVAFTLATQDDVAQPRLISLLETNVWTTTAGISLTFDLPDVVLDPQGWTFVNEHWLMPGAFEAASRLKQLLLADAPEWQGSGGHISINDGYDPTRARSLHTEARALDIQPLGDLLGKGDRLAGLAWIAGFDWVYHEEPGENPHVHASVARSFETNRILAQLNSPANLLITAPDGRRTGVDPTTGQLLSEIPQSAYSGPESHPETFEVIGADEGAFTFQVTGTGVGPFTLMIQTTDTAGVETQAQFDGLTAPGVVTTYRLNYDAEDASQTIVEIVNADPGLGTLSIPVTLQQAIDPTVEADFDAYQGHLDAGLWDVPFDLPSLGLTGLIGFTEFVKQLNYGEFQGTYEEVIVGTRRSDRLVGSEGDDLILGLRGKDTLIGNGGNDIFVGGQGIDVYLGGDGDDTFLFDVGVNGSDRFEGGAGFDTARAVNPGVIIGVHGYDNAVEAFQGHSSGDTLIRDRRTSNLLNFSETLLIDIAEVDAGRGKDTIIASNLSPGAYRGGSQADILQSGSQDVTWLYSGTNNGSDTFIQGDPSATVIALVESPGTVIGVRDFANGVDIVQGYSAGDTLIRGTRGSNRLDFSSTSLVDIALIDGGGGRDTLIGSDLTAGRFRGGPGRDTLVASQHTRDEVIVGRGRDTVAKFEPGRDLLVVEATGKDLDFEELTHRVTEAGGDTVFDFGRGDSVRILDTLFAELGVGDFDFLKGVNE